MANNYSNLSILIGILVVSQQEIDSYESFRNIPFLISFARVECFVSLNFSKGDPIKC